MKKSIISASLAIVAFVGLATAGNPGGSKPYQHPSVFPATQELGAADTITADACGGVKRITATAARTTSTSYTIGTLAANAGKEGCTMDVVNVAGTNGQWHVITLDNNESIKTWHDLDIVLGTKHSARFVSFGSYWVQIGSANNNQ